MKVGCHVSIAGGIFNAPKNAHDVGCEVYQIFTRSPRGGPAGKLTKDILKQWQDENKKYGFTEWVVHTPYYINFGSTNDRIRNSSAKIIREELERASTIGAKFLMTHLGSSKDVTPEKGLSMVVEGLGQALKGYAGVTTFCIEIAAGSGSVMGSKFEEVAAMIERIEKNDKKLKGKIGVCFDTCHAFASGYDFRDAKSVATTLKAFDQTIGLSRLKLFHANDSMFELGGHRDRHDHIGRGKIGVAGFKALIHQPKLKDCNLYLETEPDGVVADIAKLKKLRAS